MGRRPHAWRWRVGEGSRLRELVDQRLHKLSVFRQINTTETHPEAHDMPQNLLTSTRTCLQLQALVLIHESRRNVHHRTVTSTRTLKCSNKSCPQTPSVTSTSMKKRGVPCGRVCATPQQVPGAIGTCTGSLCAYMCTIVRTIHNVLASNTLYQPAARRPARCPRHHMNRSCNVM